MYNYYRYADYPYGPSLYQHSQYNVQVNQRLIVQKQPTFPPWPARELQSWGAKAGPRKKGPSRRRKLRNAISLRNRWSTRISGWHRFRNRYGTYRQRRKPTRSLGGRNTPKKVRLSRRSEKRIKSDSEARCRIRLKYDKNIKMRHPSRINNEKNSRGRQRSSQFTRVRSHLSSESKRVMITKPNGEEKRKRKREDEDDDGRKSRRLAGLPEYAQQDPHKRTQMCEGTFVSPPPAYTASATSGTKRKREDESDTPSRRLKLRRESFDRGTPPSYWQHDDRSRLSGRLRDPWNQISPPPAYTPEVTSSKRKRPWEDDHGSGGRKSRRLSIDRTPIPYYFEHDDRVPCTSMWQGFSPPPAYTPTPQNHHGCPYRVGMCRCPNYSFRY